MRRGHLIGTGAVLIAMVGSAVLLPLNGVPQTAAIPATSTGIPFSLPIPTSPYKTPSEIESLRRQAVAEESARLEAERLAAEEAARQEEQRRAAAAQQEEERRQAAAAEKARNSPAPTRAPAPPAAPSSSGDDATRLCIMRKESGGNYSIVSSNGMYHGAYQFSRPTGDATARRMGRPDLVGTPVSRWSPAEQDQAFWTLWNGGAGRGNWPTARGC